MSVSQPSTPGPLRGIAALIRDTSESSQHPLTILRTALLLTQEELAKRARIGVRTLIYIEAGYRASLRVRRNIIDALGVSLQDGARLFPPATREYPLRAGAKRRCLKTR